MNESDAAVSNTPVQSETGEPGGRKKVRIRRNQAAAQLPGGAGRGAFRIRGRGQDRQEPHPVRIITPKGKAAQAKYAAEVTGPLLAQLEDYFGVPYPYEKLDLLSVPLFGGAMENAGTDHLRAEPDAARPGAG